MYSLKEVGDLGVCRAYIEWTERVRRVIKMIDEIERDFRILESYHSELTVETIDIVEEMVAESRDHLETAITVIHEDAEE